MTFANLADAGAQLARTVRRVVSDPDPLILAAMPNGVPVALPVAAALGVRAHALAVDRSGGEPRIDPPTQPIESRTVIVIDDGVETGAVARAAATALQSAGRLILAVPVCSHEILADLRQRYDLVVAVDKPLGRRSLAWHYVDFDVIDEAAAVALLDGQGA